jgi:putative ABC transport system ATP-binding protein
MEALGLVELSHRHDHLPGQMSGGEQQRVAVARALVIEPALVLADEPTGNLDSVNSKRVTALLRKLVSAQGQTVVMVTHDLNVAAAADRIIRVRDGRIEDEITHDVAARVAELTETGSTLAQVKTTPQPTKPPPPTNKPHTQSAKAKKKRR